MLASPFASPTRYNKSVVKSKSVVLLIVSLVLCFRSLTAGQAADKNASFPGSVRSANLDYRTELPQGYLKVYSATDEVNNGTAWYFAHTSYAIYTIGGKLFKNVKNQRFPADEIPEVVALPVGTYVVLARSEREGYDRILVVIKEGYQTIVDLDVWEKKTRQSARN